MEKKLTEDESRSYIRKKQKKSVIQEAKPGYDNIVCKLVN